jgi:hypothetical protein
VNKFEINPKSKNMQKQFYNTITNVLKKKNDMFNDLKIFEK